MTFLVLQPLTSDLLPAVVELDQRCFGGLWSLDGYRRELDSPNSELFVLWEEEGKAEGKGQRAEVRSQDPGARIFQTGTLREQNVEFKTQNSELKTPNSQLSTLNSPLIGIGCYWAIAEEAHIIILGIDPERQRLGLGQTLLWVLLESASRRGLEWATLEVRISNQSALDLYQKFGFREAGRRKRYYQDTGEDALVLWRGGLQKPEFSQLLNAWWEKSCDRLHRSGYELSTGWEPFLVKESGLT